MTSEELDLLADTDPLRLRDEAITLLARAETAEAQRDGAVHLLYALADDEPCVFDHHGDCQSHWGGLIVWDDGCAVAAARVFLADFPKPEEDGE